MRLAAEEFKQFQRATALLFIALLILATTSSVLLVHAQTALRKEVSMSTSHNGFSLIEVSGCVHSEENLSAAGADVLPVALIDPNAADADELLSVKAEDSHPPVAVGEGAAHVVPVFASGISNQVIVEVDGQTGWQEMRDNTLTVVRWLLSFVITPLRRVTIIDDGTEYLECIAEAPGGRRKRLVLIPDVWPRPTAFSKVMPGMEFVSWIKNTNDLQSLRLFLSRKPFLKATGCRQVGFHKNAFVTTTKAATKEGLTITWVWVPSNKKAPVYDSRILDYEPVTESELAGFRELLPVFNAPQVALPILGWTVACFFKSEIFEQVKAIGGFPILAVEGEPGAGKTVTIKQIIMRLWAVLGEPLVASRLTRYALMDACALNNALPLVIDEYKPHMMSRDRNNAISELVRSSYNGETGRRGRANQGIEEYTYSSPLVIAGEGCFIENAVLDRSVSVFMSKADSQVHSDMFNALQTMPIEKLGRLILNYRLSVDREHIKDILDAELESVEGLVGRPRVNAAVVRLGLRVVQEVLRIELDLSVVEAAMKADVTDETHDRKSCCDIIIEKMAQMSMIKADGKPYYSGGLAEGVHYKVRDGQVWLWVPGAYPQFLKWAASFKQECELLPEKGFGKQLKLETYCIEHAKVVNFAGHSVRCYVLDIDKMHDKGIELVPEWGASEEIAIVEQQEGTGEV